MTNSGKPAAPREIERKFLLQEMPANLTSYPHREIAQGYLAASREEGIQVRLRQAGEDRSLTYKRGTTWAREEREISLSAEQFDALWPGTEGRRLTKVRYRVPLGERVMEVDVYTGRHAGVVVAEVEFPDENSCEAFVPPDWFGEEVTGSARYSNVVMAHDSPLA